MQNTTQQTHLYIYRKTLYLQYIDCVHTRVCACISGIAKTGSNVTHFPLNTSLIAKHQIMLKQLITYFKFTNDTSWVQNSPSRGKWCNSRRDGVVPRVQIINMHCYDCIGELIAVQGQENLQEHTCIPRVQRVIYYHYIYVQYTDYQNLSLVSD